MTEFEEERGERRNFYCSNKLWNEIKKATKGCYSTSEFIRQAIVDKLEKENPDITKLSSSKYYQQNFYP